MTIMRQLISRAMLTLSMVSVSSLALASESKSKPLPQFRPEHFPTQLFWLAVTFALLYVLMVKFVLPHIEGVQIERTSKLEGDLAMARSAQEEAEAMVAAHDRAMREARQNAQDKINVIVSQARKKAQDETSQQEIVLEARINAAHERIIALKQEALMHEQEAATTVAQDILSRLIDVPVANNLAVIDDVVRGVKAANGRA